MRITRTDNSPTNIILKVEADSSDLEPIRRHVLGHYANRVKVPGFREGKAPAYIVEKNINQQAMLDEFMEHALNDLYRKAVEQQKIRPVSNPEVKLKKFVPYTNMEFEATLEIIGPIKLANYKTIKLTKKKAQVTAKDVDDVIKSLQSRSAERVAVNRPAKNGDEVVIDFVGIDKKGKPVPGADSKDYPLLLGSNTFIPGFEDKLVGAKAGETKEFKITFPENYSVSSLRKQPVTFTVEVKKINELKEPKLDDGFAAKVGPFKTVADLRKDVKKQLEEEKTRQAEVEFQNELIAKISEKSTVELPESLIDEEVARLEEEEKRNLAYRGQTWQDHLEAEGVTEEEHRQRNRPDAANRVKAGLVLSEIADKENIIVTPEEMDLRVQMLKAQYQDPQMQAEIDKPENQRDIMSRIMTEKTIAKLTSYASK